MDEVDQHSEKFERVRQRILTGLTAPTEFASQLSIINDMIENGQTPFKSLKEFTSAPENHDGIGIRESDKLEMLLWYNPRYEHISKKLSAKLGIAELAKETEAIGFKGKKEKKRTPDNPENVSCTPSDTGSPKQYGNSNAYRISVLKRDHPQVAERLEAGEIKSVVEAERLAGTKPPKRESKRLTMFMDDREGAQEALNQFYGVTTSVTTNAINEASDSLIEEQFNVGHGDLDEKMTRFFDGLPKHVAKKINNKFHWLCKQLGKDFRDQVETQVKEEVAEERVKIDRVRTVLHEEKQKLKIERERLAKMRRNITGIMTKEEFGIVRLVCHPDKNSSNELKTKASRLVNELKGSVDFKGMSKKDLADAGWD